MPIVKPIAGHTRCANVMRYLTRKDRALACDYLNIDAPVTGHENGLPVYGDVDWAAVMDATRHRHGNDEPWRGRRVRTYAHYVVSPDPKDKISLPALRELATAWAQEHFPDHEVAIVYHDDNAGGIPHAYLVVNNTDLSTGRRLQVPDPKALNRLMQLMAAERGLSALDNVDRAGAAPRQEREGRGRARRRPPRTLQKVHRSRAEAELGRNGQYSWVADIRARVEIACGATTSEPEFRSMLAQMGVTVADNSPRARRPDWLYALADEPDRRVSGENLGLLYCRESMERRFAYGGSRMADADRATVAEVARNAVEVGDLAALRELAAGVSLVERLRVRSVAELDRAVARGEADAGDPAVRTARESGMLPAETRLRPRRQPEGRAWTGRAHQAGRGNLGKAGGRQEGHRDQQGGRAGGRIGREQR